MGVLSGLGRFYRVFRWVVLAAALLALFLILRTAEPPQVQTDPAAAERLKFKLYQFDRAAEAGRPHTLELNEAELNTFLQSSLALRSPNGAPAETPAAQAPAAPAGEPTLEQVQSSVRDVKINLVGDRVRAYVLFDLYGKDLSLVLEGRLRVVDGYLRLEPTSGTLGSLPIPQATLDNAVSRLFDSPENKEKFRVPPEIADIRVEDGQLRISRR